VANEKPLKGGTGRRTISHTLGGFFIRFVSRPWRDAGLLVVLSRHCEDSVLLYRVMQGLVPVGTLVHWPSPHGTARTLSSCTVLCKVSFLSGRIAILYYFAEHLK